MIIMPVDAQTKNGGGMDALESTLTLPTTRRGIAPLTVILAMIFVFFCGVLVFVYAATKRANPIMLDQQGEPVSSQSQHVGDGKR